MKTKTKICGIYGLVDPDTKEVRYIGSSKDCNRRFYSHCSKTNSCNKDRFQWINFLREQGKAPELIILKECEEKDLAKYEIYYIKEYKLSNLLNERIVSVKPRSIFSKNLKTGEIKFYEKPEDYIKEGFKKRNVHHVYTDAKYSYRGYRFWYADNPEPDTSGFTYNNKTQKLTEWAKEYNLSYSTLCNRIFNLKMTLEKALTTPVTQNIKHKFKDKELTLTEWSKELNISLFTLSSRIRRGWNIEKIVNTPIKPIKQKKVELPEDY